MARILAYDMNNFSVGETRAICDRGWMVDGVSSTSGGGETSFVISKTVLQNGWFMPGRMVYIPHAKLPPYAGFVDTPIGLQAPAAVKIYNAEYLLKIRAPERTQTLKGPVADIARQMLEQVNDQEETFLRMGEMGGSGTYREETLDQRSYWEQLNAMVLRSGSEMIFRPKIEPNDGNRLYIYIDILDRVGVDTDLLLHDGDNGNIVIQNATMEGEIWNRVSGINGSSAAEDRKIAGPYKDTTSIQAFRTRSRTVQFRSTQLNSTLDAQTFASLKTSKSPILRFDVLIKDRADKGDPFRNIAPGNGVILHAANVILPDGSKGWVGTARLMAMAYNEKTNTCGGRLEAYYNV